MKVNAKAIPLFLQCLMSLNGNGSMVSNRPSFSDSLSHTFLQRENLRILLYVRTRFLPRRVDHVVRVLDRCVSGTYNRWRVNTFYSSTSSTSCASLTPGTIDSSYLWVGTDYSIGPFTLSVCMFSLPLLNTNSTIKDSSTRLLLFLKLSLVAILLGLFSLVHNEIVLNVCWGSLARTILFNTAQLCCHQCVKMDCDVGVCQSTGVNHS